MRWLVILVCLWPLQLLAQSPENQVAVVDPISPSYLMKLTAGLLFVVAVVFFIAWLLKRLNLTQNTQGGVLRIIAGLPVGTRDRIVLVQVGEEQILVGLSPGRMAKLHTLNHPVAVHEGAQIRSPFTQKINELMRKGPGN